MKRTISALIVSALLAGCATTGTGQNYVPIIDMRDVDLDKARQDTTECQEYAKQTMNAGQGAMAGAVAGALLGALLAPRGYRNEWAGQAAVLGGLGGAGSAEGGQRGIIGRCMTGRGYKVLN